MNELNINNKHDVKIGQCTVLPTELTHLFVEGEITIRGQTRRFNAHFYLWLDGLCHVGKPEERKTWNDKPCIPNGNPYVNTQWNGKAWSDAKLAFRQMLVETLEPAVQK